MDCAIRAACKSPPSKVKQYILSLDRNILHLVMYSGAKVVLCALKKAIGLFFIKDAIMTVSTGGGEAASIGSTFLDHVVLVGTGLRLALQEARVTSAVEHVDNNNKKE